MYRPAVHNLLVPASVNEPIRVAATSRRDPSATPAAPSPGGAKARPDRDRSTYLFIRHYAEMVAVMFAGMFAVMGPTGWLFSAFGTSWDRLSPAIDAFAMALTMTAPMVAWMRYRGHTWRADVEMAASMLIPTFAVMGVLWAGLANGDLTVPEHAGMLTWMLVAMLLRRDEYSCATNRGQAQPAIAA